jgi:hypothetical protein
MRSAAAPEPRTFVEPGGHGTLVRGLVAEHAVSPLTHRTVYRVVDFASEMLEPDTGKWLPHDKLSHISSPHNER